MVETIADDHGDDERDGGQPREQPEDDQRAAQGFHSANERTHKVGKRNSDPGETPSAQNLRKGQLLDALRQENDETDQKADEDGRRSGLGLLK